ncbi:MAG: tetratricopeptide repeat protein, partial [Chloroflexi bacterium]|nr:tetratricopeptide repeat protein [Chloroflexota bacterium]
FDPTQSSPSEEQPIGEWFISGASFLAPLLDQGLSLDALLETLRIVLPVVKAIQMITRRQLLQTSATTLMGSIPHFHSKHVSEEERMRLCQVFSESITEGWHLFGSSSNALVLALAQAVLALIQYAHSFLYPRTRLFLYTGAYSLVGITLHFQERDQEALQAHQSGYIAALATGDPWYVAQSLICQSDCYHFLGQHDVAIQTIEEALRTIGVPSNNAQVCARAHLLTCWADNSMALKDYRTAQEKLEASAVYLDHIALNEEFDRAAWHMLAGKYSLMTKDYSTALDHFKESLTVLPEAWTLRRTMTSIGLIKAYAQMKERDQSLIVADKVVPMVQAINARVTNRWFNEYLHQDLLGTFPTDERVHTFVRDVYKRLPQLIDVSSN